MPAAAAAATAAIAAIAAAIAAIAAGAATSRSPYSVCVCDNAILTRLLSMNSKLFGRT